MEVKEATFGREELAVLLIYLLKKEQKNCGCSCQHIGLSAFTAVSKHPDSGLILLNFAATLK